MKAHGLLRDEIDGRDGGTHRLETLKGLDRNAMLALAGCEEKDKHVTCNGGFKRRHEGDGRLAYPGGGVGEERCLPSATAFRASARNSICPGRMSWKGQGIGDAPRPDTTTVSSRGIQAPDGFSASGRI